MTITANNAAATIAYDTLQIILDYADPGTRAMISRKAYYDLFEKKKYNMAVYMKKNPDNGLARQLLIKHYFDSGEYNRAFELCITKDHLIQLFALLMTKNINDPYIRFHNRSNNREWELIDNNIANILTHFIEQNNQQQTDHENIAALIEWLYYHSFKISNRITGHNINIKSMAANRMLLAKEFSIRLLKHILDHFGSLEACFDIIASNINPTDIKYIAKSSRLYSELMPKLLTDKIFRGRCNDYCLKCVMTDYPRLFNHYHYTAATLVGNIDQLMQSGVSYESKKNMINDRYYEILSGHDDPRSLLKDMPKEFVDKILFAIVPIKVSVDMVQKTDETLRELQASIESINDNMAGIKDAISNISESINDNNNTANNVYNTLDRLEDTVRGMDGTLSNISGNIVDTYNAIDSLNNTASRIDDNVVVVINNQ